MQHFLSHRDCHVPSPPCVPADSMFVNGSGSAAPAILIVIKLSINANFIKVSRSHYFSFYICNYTEGASHLLRKATALVLAIRGVGMCISRFQKVESMSLPCSFGGLFLNGILMKVEVLMAIYWIARLSCW